MGLQCKNPEKETGRKYYIYVYRMDGSVFE